MTGVTPPSEPLLPGPRLWLAIVLIVAGVALMIPTLIAGVAPIVRSLSSAPIFQSPQARLHLGHGTYLVYEDTGNASFGSSFSGSGDVTITPADVTVTADDGTRIEVLDRPSTVDTRVTDGVRFVGAVRFTTPAAGYYTVSVEQTGSKPVLVAPPLTDTIRRVLGWFLLTGLGAIVAIVGLVLLIVGSVRRGRVRRAFAYATPVPPGWHPDPGGSGRLRYWDGYRWTEHLQ